MSVQPQTVPVDHLGLRESRDGSALTVEVTGDVDLANAHRLAECLEKATASDAERVILDLRPVGFIDSTGLRVVLVAARELGDRLWVYQGTGDPAKVIALTAIDQTLNLLD